MPSRVSDHYWCARDSVVLIGCLVVDAAAKALSKEVSGLRLSEMTVADLQSERDRRAFSMRVARPGQLNFFCL